MRIIKFRGKRSDSKTKDWVYGYFTHTNKNFHPIIHISTIEVYPVVPETVGQFTGLKDKNGKDIYEGDIVRWTNGKHYWEAEIRTLPDNKSNTLYAVETFCNLSTYFDEHDEELYSFERTDERKGIRNEIEFLSSTTEIIGNRFSNPELLS